MAKRPRLVVELTRGARSAGGWRGVDGLERWSNRNPASSPARASGPSARSSQSPLVQRRYAARGPGRRRAAGAPLRPRPPPSRRRSRAGRGGDGVVPDRDPAASSSGSSSPRSCGVRGAGPGRWPELVDDLQALAVRQPLQPRPWSPRQPREPGGPAALKDELSVTVHRTARRCRAHQHHEGGRREAALAEQGQAGLEQAAVAVVEAQQDPLAGSDPRVHGLEHVVHGHRRMSWPGSRARGNDTGSSIVVGEPVGAEPPGA